MDSFTQIALGATVAEVGFRKQLGGRAVLWGGFCGLVPDLDIALVALDPWNEIIHHRGASHSFLMLTLFTPLFGWLGAKIGKGRGTWKTWSHLSFWSLVTHPMLDIFTSFGTQVFWPITNRRYAWDGASIVDPVYTLPLLVVLVLALKRGDPPRWRRRFSAVVLGLTTAYLVFGTAMMSIAKSRAEAQLAENGFEATHLRVLPAIGTNLLFRVVARDVGSARRIGYVSVLSDQPIRFACADSDDSERAAELLDSKGGRIFNWFADELLLLRNVDGEMQLVDLRFGTPRTPISTLFAFTTHNGTLPLARMSRPTIQLGEELGSIWTALRDGWSGECDETFAQAPSSP
ncbi:MAG: metal-dependent hydrolase [Myxococcota bacterium]